MANKTSSLTATNELTIILPDLQQSYESEDPLPAYVTLQGPLTPMQNRVSEKIIALTGQLPSTECLDRARRREICLNGGRAIVRQSL